MKNINYFAILFAFILFACNPAQKSFERGQFDKAIAQSIKKLHKKPNDIKHLRILEESFIYANENDNARLNYLQSKDPVNWDEVVLVYKKLMDRQDKVKTSDVIPNGIVFVDYTSSKTSAKENAIQDNYSVAKKLLESDQKSSIREAYDRLLKIKEYNPNFKSIDSLLQDTKQRGTNFVVVKYETQMNATIPSNLMEYLQNNALENTNTSWTTYAFSFEDSTKIDYKLIVSLKKYEIDAGKETERRTTERKEVKDGWEYEYDSDGRIKLDKDGNQVKKDKFKTISCQVTERTQRRKASITGDMIYSNAKNNQILSTVPVSGESIFENKYIITNGDKNALSAETTKLLNNKPMSYPNEDVMQKQAADKMKIAIKDAMKNNQSLFN
jgi:hypothetical protein